MARMNGLVTYLLPTIQPAAGRQSPRTTRVGFSYLQMRRLRVLRILKGSGEEGAVPRGDADQVGRGPPAPDQEPAAPVVPALQLGHAVVNDQLPFWWTTRAWSRSWKQPAPWSGLRGLLRRGWYRWRRSRDEAPCSMAAPPSTPGRAIMTGHRHLLSQSGHQRNVSGLQRGGGSPRRSQMPPARRW